MLYIHNVLALGMPGPFEWVFIALIGLLLFGKRLPEVGRSLGKGIVEFKKGLNGIEDEMDTSVNRPSSPPAKFDPYTGKALDQSSQSVGSLPGPQPRFDPYTGQPLQQTQQHQP